MADAELRTLQLLLDSWKDADWLLEARLAKAEQRAYNQNLEALKEKQRGDIAEAQRDEAVRALQHIEAAHAPGWGPEAMRKVLAQPWAQEVKV